MSNTNFLETLFPPSVLTEWNKLDSYKRDSESSQIFKKHILTFIRPKPNSIFNVHNPLGIKYLTRLRVGFSHLKEHTFNHNFQDSVDPMCSCGNGIETTKHFILHCANFSSQRQALFDKIRIIDEYILTESEDNIVNVLLFGKPNSDNAINMAILKLTIEFITSSERFNGPLL